MTFRYLDHGHVREITGRIVADWGDYLIVRPDDRPVRDITIPRRRIVRIHHPE